eukprot:TRINITY_DN2051_c0_g3_i1.p1 TRINITY_DN2051_c0_g3~~TRINITY_DN2051_c0_g3_i1.p1  ORF type:complete len:668 (+),score=241.80 TRINITY_DN2051_c0_g3_i1:330-2333(+)
MGDSQTKERRAAFAPDTKGGRHARDDGAVMQASTDKRRARHEEEYRRRARTTGAETKNLVPIVDADRYATVATCGENPTVKEPKGIRMLGIRFLDPSITNCVSCAVAFTTTNRRHWCRRCGRIFCDICSSKRQQLYTGGPLLRVCRACTSPILFKLPVQLLQVITSYLANDTMVAVLSTCHRFQLSINLPYKEVRNIHDIYDKSATKYLQKGAFGCVYSARLQKSDEPAAIKVIDKYHVYSLREWHFIKREVDLHRDLKHPHVVELKRVYQTRSKVYIVMELGKGDLFDYMMEKGFMTEAEVASITVQLLTALEYLHNVAHVVHRDVKPENILVFHTPPGGVAAGGHPCPPGSDPRYPTVKLCDFGLAKRFEGSGTPEAVSCTPCGTLSYCPPEVLSKTLSTTTDRLCKLDIFSLGIVLHVLISGNEPFKGKSPSELLKSMKKPLAFTGKEWRGVAESMRNMVAAMLRYSTPKRPTAAEALAMLTGPPETPKTPVLAPPMSATAAALPIVLPSGRGSPAVPGLATPPSLSLAESLGTLPLVDSSTFKERVTASVVEGFAFRVGDEDDGSMKVDAVRRANRIRGQDGELPKDLVDVRTAQDFDCMADYENSAPKSADEARMWEDSYKSDSGPQAFVAAAGEREVRRGSEGPQRSACIPVQAAREIDIA